MHAHTLSTNAAYAKIQAYKSHKDGSKRTPQKGGAKPPKRPESQLEDKLQKVS
jgi:hypothetical protein